MTGQVTTQKAYNDPLCLKKQSLQTESVSISQMRKIIPVKEVYHESRLQVNTAQQMSETQSSPRSIRRHTGTLSDWCKIPALVWKWYQREEGCR